MRRWVACLIVTAAMAVGGGALLYDWALKKLDSPGPLGEDRILVVPKGAGLSRIATTLTQQGVIDNALYFRLAARYLKADQALKAGEFAFPAAISMRQVIETLREGKVVIHRLTLAEGLTSYQMVALIEQAEALSGSVPRVPAEGTLLPETYHFARGDDRGALLARMETALTETLAELWATRDEGLPFKTPAEALVLASIVEKETALPEERPLISGVFVNRLRKPMRLQSDPTVVYGLTGGKGPLGRPLTRRDLKQATPFNTYVIDGLPPHPIANPGRDALAAVLHPAKTEHLYFVADGSGGHSFARTLAEHNRNVAKWRKIEKARGQKAAD